jgi:hypothetical protein
MLANRRDLRKLKSISGMAGKLRSAYTGLSQPTKEMLQREFRGGTENHIFRFEANINQVVESIKLPKP